MDYIPVIDLSKIQIDSQNENNKEWNSIATEIRKALHGIGFMYLINHGVPSDVIKDGFQSSSKFFNLDSKIKENYRKDLSKSRHGWVEPGRELLHPNSVFELRECFDHVKGEHDGVAECPEFYQNIKKFRAECNTLIRKLLKLFAIALELEDPEYFVKCCEHLNNSNVPNECDFSAIYYPPIPKEKEIPVGTVRCAEHTDYEIITLLFQDMVGGLQVKAASGSWLSATPVPGAILVNTGDLLEFWTNGYFPATVHRVVIPQTEIDKRVARYSFAYFFAPDSDTLVSPLQSKVIDELPKSTNQVSSITAYDHIIRRVKEAYQY